MYNRRTIMDAYREITEHVRSEILRESEAQIIGSDTEELAKYYFDQYSFSPIEIDDTKESNWEHENYVKNIPAHEREEFYQYEGDKDWPCERVIVRLPLKNNQQIGTISKLTSSTYSVSFSGEEFNWTPGMVSFSIETKGYGVDSNEDKIASDINSGLGRINQIISWKNKDIEEQNQILMGQIISLINGRKTEIKNNKQKVDSLTKKIDIPLKKKESQGAQNVDLKHKPIVKLVKPSPQQPEEYVLDENKVKGIIEIIDNQGDAFEKTPATFKTLGEEALRDLILGSLNVFFAGSATGETFSKKGKTDIYLNIKKGSILVLECKFWGGSKLYLGAIKQLRGYLTWRHNYGVIITFVKVKNFTQVINKIEETVKNSPCYVGGFQQISDTQFISRHKLDDDDKEVKIYHLFYNIYSD